MVSGCRVTRIIQRCRTTRLLDSKFAWINAKYPIVFRNAHWKTKLPFLNGKQNGSWNGNSARVWLPAFYLRSDRKRAINTHSWYGKKIKILQNESPRSIEWELATAASSHRVSTKLAYKTCPLFTLYGKICIQCFVVLLSSTNPEQITSHFERSCCKSSEYNFVLQDQHQIFPVRHLCSFKGVCTGEFPKRSTSE